MTAPEDTEVGKRYRVEFKDCCVEGHFEAVLEVKNYVPNSPDDPTPFLDSLTFANGVTISDGIGVRLTEASGQGDDVQALLSEGGPVTSQEQADMLGLGSAYRKMTER